MDELPPVRRSAALDESFGGRLVALPMLMVRFNTTTQPCALLEGLRRISSVARFRVRGGPCPLRKSKGARDGRLHLHVKHRAKPNAHPVWSMTKLQPHPPSVPTDEGHGRPKRQSRRPQASQTIRLRCGLICQRPSLRQRRCTHLSSARPQSRVFALFCQLRTWNCGELISTSAVGSSQQARFDRPYRRTASRSVATSPCP